MDLRGGMFVFRANGSPQLRTSTSTLCINVFKSASVYSTNCTDFCTPVQYARTRENMKEKPQASFLEEYHTSFELDDVDSDIDIDEFDLLLPDDPQTADWHRIADKTGKRSLFLDKKMMHRIIREVKSQRLEKRIRKHITHILEASGGSVSMVELMRRVDGVDGQAGANASVSLVYVMQAEGLVVIETQQQLYNFTFLGEHHHFSDDNIMVRLLRNR